MRKMRRLLFEQKLNKYENKEEKKNNTTTESLFRLKRDRCPLYLYLTQADTIFEPTQKLMLDTSETTI